MSEQFETARLDEYLAVMASLESDLKGRTIDRFYADEVRDSYASHLNVFRAGSEFRERAMLGGNRVGKSTAGSYEVALHLTGEYPDWWKGYRFDKPTKVWAAGETRDATRDIVQEKLMGEPHAHGSGMLPKDSILDIRKRHGIPDALDSVQVRHKSGGISTLQFKSFAEGREGFQGQKIHFIWMDEEPSLAVYQECLMRTAKTSEAEQAGRVLLTLTPMKGLSNVANHFLTDGRLCEEGDRFASQVGWDDIPHLSEEEKAELLLSIPKHQRDARTKGYPTLGVGSVYSYSETNLVCEAFEIPPYFWGSFGLDVGWNCSAVVFVRYDPDLEVYFITDEIKLTESSPADVAQAIKCRNRFQWGVVDPASRGRSQIDGKSLMNEYRDLDLKLRPAKNAVEAGLHRVQMLMSTGKLKVFPSCMKLLAELRKYSRDENGKIRKQDDHLLDALRYVLFTETTIRPLMPMAKPKVRRAMG
jgi:phage terminase large subunit-like protein